MKTAEEIVDPFVFDADNWNVGITKDDAVKCCEEYAAQFQGIIPQSDVDAMKLFARNNRVPFEEGSIWFEDQEGFEKKYGREIRGYMVSYYELDLGQGVIWPKVICRNLYPHGMAKNVVAMYAAAFGIIFGEKGTGIYTWDESGTSGAVVSTQIQE